MSDATVHSFSIPHDKVEPTRDMIVIRLPRPPEKVGSILIPGQSRDLAQHNVMAGRIVSMGPLAFQYKTVNEAGETVMARQRAEIGDWVVIRPFAGTMVQGGQLVATSGWRYVSSFADVISVVPSEHMPETSTLLWDEDESQQSTEGAAVDLKAEKVKAAAADFSFTSAREKDMADREAADRASKRKAK